VLSLCELGIVAPDNECQRILFASNSPVSAHSSGFPWIPMDFGGSDATVKQTACSRVWTADSTQTTPARALPERAWAKEAIFPADRFPGAADRGVEMRSTGEVMASGTDVVEAYRRALRAAGRSRSRGGPVRPLQAA
jgi:hypothetical protein